MSSAEERGQEAVEALQKVFGEFGRLKLGRSGLEEFQSAAKDYVAAQAAFTLACVDAMNTPGMKRTVRHFTDGFIDSTEDSA